MEHKDDYGLNNFTTIYVEGSPSLIKKQNHYYDNPSIDSSRNVTPQYVCLKLLYLRLY